MCKLFELDLLMMNLKSSIFKHQLLATYYQQKPTEILPAISNGVWRHRIIFKKFKKNNSTNNTENEVNKSFKHK